MALWMMPAEGGVFRFRRLPPVTFACPACGKGKTVPHAWFKRVKRPTCSRACSYALNAERLARFGDDYGPMGRAAFTDETRAKLSARRGAASASWKGGVRTNALGYREVLQHGHHRAKSTGYVTEHTLVAEQMLGRLLRPGEVVHHINNDRADNRPENLQVFASNSEHLRIAHGRGSRKSPNPQRGRQTKESR